MQHPRIGKLVLGQIHADPIVQGEVVEAVDTRRQQKRFPRQQDQGQDHHRDDEGRDQDTERRPPNAELDRALAEALSSDGDETLSNAENARVHIDEHHRDHHQDQCKDKAVAPVPGIERGVDLGRKRKKPDRQPEQGRRAEGAEDTDEGQHDGGAESRQQKGKRDLYHPLGAGEPADGARLLELRIHGHQGAGHQEKGVGVVVKRQADNDRHHAVGQPVGRLDA